MRCRCWGDGELTLPLTIHATQFSGSARAKIEAAGGTIVEVPAKVRVVLPLVIGTLCSYLGVAEFLPHLKTNPGCGRGQKIDAQHKACLLHPPFTRVPQGTTGLHWRLLGLEKISW